MKAKIALLVVAGMVVALIVGAIYAVSPSSPAESAQGSDILPGPDGTWVPTEPRSTPKPTETGYITIEEIGALSFDAGQVQTLRPDIFQPGHFSMFDILVHLAEQGEINLEYRFDEAMDTHIIDAINGQDGWWYTAFYSGGWTENNAFRMDMYPYKERATIRVYREGEERLARLYNAFRVEVKRLADNDGQVIIPQVRIKSPAYTETFENVVVTAHDIRTDVLQPGVITSLDVLLSLADQGKLSQIKLTWYDTIADADPVDSYFVEQINEAVAVGSCGFVYETGPLKFAGFSGDHIHIPSDLRVNVSPEYAYWFWICI